MNLKQFSRIEIYNYIRNSKSLLEDLLVAYVDYIFEENKDWFLEVYNQRLLLLKVSNTLTISEYREVIYRNGTYIFSNSKNLEYKVVDEKFVKRELIKNCLKQLMIKKELPYLNEIRTCNVNYRKFLDDKIINKVFSLLLRDVTLIYDDEYYNYSIYF